MAETPQDGPVADDSPEGDAQRYGWDGVKWSTRPVHPGMGRISLKQTFDKPPNLGQSLLPVVGPAWDAGYQFEHDNPAAGAADLGFAALDVLAVGKVAGWVGQAIQRGIDRGFGEALASGWSQSAVRSRLVKSGLVQPGQELHHGIIPNGRWGENVPKIVKNSSWNLKPLDPVTHDLVHGSSLNPVQKTWIGAPDSVKAAGLYATDHVGVGIADGQQAPDDGSR